MTDSKNFPAVEKKTTKITSGWISGILDNGDLVNEDILDKMGLDQKSATVLSYHLKKMLKEKTVEKKDGKWHKISKPQSDVEEEIFEILLEDDCSLKKPEIIKEKIKEDISEETLLWTLQTLCNIGKIYEHKKEFGISSLEVNKYNRCFICKKEFKDNQLIISIIFPDEGIGVVHNCQSHALCRNKIDKENDIWSNNSSSDCDYCGLSLSAKILLHNKTENINLDKEIDTLFNEPFSKIFSSIDSSNHGDENTHVTSFACPKTENGKQYHPYCFDIIQKPKKGNR
jgi:hypothetical protein